MTFLAIINSQVDSEYVFFKPVKHTFNSFGICRDFRNMFANQIINFNKIGRGMLNLLKKINSGYLATTLSASLACKHCAYQ